MTAAFAALKTRANRAVMKHLADSEALYTPAGGGAAMLVEGEFDAAYATQLEELAGDSTPAFICSVEDVGEVRRGATLVIDGTTFEVVRPEPDGAGFVVMRLRSA